MISLKNIEVNHKIRVFNTIIDFNKKRLLWLNPLLSRILFFFSKSMEKSFYYLQYIAKLCMSFYCDPINNTPNQASIQDDNACVSIY